MIQCVDLLSWTYQPAEVAECIDQRPCWFSGNRQHFVFFCSHHMILLLALFKNSDIDQRKKHLNSFIWTTHRQRPSYISRVGFTLKITYSSSFLKYHISLSFEVVIISKHATYPSPFNGSVLIFVSFFFRFSLNTEVIKIKTADKNAGHYKRNAVWLFDWTALCMRDEAFLFYSVPTHLFN